MQLYTYHRSLASYRVRIALNLKGLAAEQRAIDLRRMEQADPAYLALNPLGRVPVLVDAGHVLTQSLAILEYLEETHAEPPLLPRDPLARAHVRALALTVCCDIQPLQNTGATRYLQETIGATPEQTQAWSQHFIERGLVAFEASLGGAAGRFCHGDAPTLADVCLVPQLYNAVRFGCDLSAVPRLVAIRDACLALPAFADAAPERQPDHAP